MKTVFVYVVCADKKEARKIARATVEARLAACANIMAPHESVYWWEGKVQTGKEVAVVFKTRASLFRRLKNKIIEWHSYDCPCVIALPVEQGHKPFLDWIAAETRKI